MVSRPRKSVPEQGEDVSQQLTPFVRVEHNMTNPVKPIAKDTPCRSRMFFDPNGFDSMAPSPDMVGPAKGEGKDSQESFYPVFILDMRCFKVKSS